MRLKPLEDTNSSPSALGGPGEGAGPVAARSSRPPSSRQRRGVASAVLLTLGAVAVATGTGLVGWFALARPAGPQIARPGPQTPVTATDQGAGTANNSPVLAADPADPRFVALANRIDAPDYGCGLHVSGDGGGGWTPVDPVPELAPGTERCHAPEVAFGPEGRLYFLFMGLAGGPHRPTGAFLTTSDDDGRTFSPPRQVLGRDSFAVRMIVDPDVGPAGRIHLVWVEARAEPTPAGFGPPPNPVLAAHSDDGGVTFSKPVQVSDPDRERVVAPAIVLGRGGAVHVAYYDLGADDVDYRGLEGSVWAKPWSVVVASSSDRGRRFGRGHVAEAGVVPPERVMLAFTMAAPALVADDRRVCVAWTDARHGDPDAFASCSQTGGRTWGAARRLNDDPLGTGSSQYLPRLGLAPGGRLDAVFYDRRDDPQNLNNAVSYTFSSDGGHSFARNLALTSEGLSFTLVGRQYDLPAAAGRFEFGSRLALLSRAEGALAAWADTHNAVPPTTAQDVFATVVEVPGRPAWERRRRPAGAVLAGIGALILAAGVVVRRRRGEDVA